MNKYEEIIKKEIEALKEELATAGYKLLWLEIFLIDTYFGREKCRAFNANQTLDNLLNQAINIEVENDQLATKISNKYEQIVFDKMVHIRRELEKSGYDLHNERTTLRIVVRNDVIFAKNQCISPDSMDEDDEYPQDNAPAVDLYQPVCLIATADTIECFEDIDKKYF